MLDLKLYSRTIVIKAACYWYNSRQVDHWNRIQDPEMNPHTYGHLIFDKGAKTIQWKKDSIFNKWCWRNCWLTCRRMHNWSILISLYKAQVQVDQGPPHKTRYIDSNRRESGEKSRTHGHRENFPKQNTSGLCSKISNRQMEPHKIAKLL